MLSSGGVSDGQAAKLRAYECKQALKRARLGTNCEPSCLAYKRVLRSESPQASSTCQTLARAPPENQRAGTAVYARSLMSVQTSPEQLRGALILSKGHSDPKCPSHYHNPSCLTHAGRHGCRTDANSPGRDQRLVELAVQAHDEEILPGTDPHPPRLGCERHRVVPLGLGESDYKGGNHLGDHPRVLQAAREDWAACRSQYSPDAAHLQGVVQAGCIRPDDPRHCSQGIDPDGEWAAFSCLPFARTRTRSSAARRQLRLRPLRPDEQGVLPAELRLAGAGWQAGSVAGDGEGTAPGDAREEGHDTDGEHQQPHADGKAEGGTAIDDSGAEDAEQAAEGRQRGGGVGDGGRAGGQDEQLAITGAVGELGVSEYDVISLVMRGGGRKFPEFTRKFTCRAPLRKRILPTSTLTIDRAAAKRAAAEISSLQKQLATATAELLRVKSSFAREIKLHVRAGVRKTHVAADVAVYRDLSALKDELVLLRRAACTSTYHFNLPSRVAELQAAVAARDATIAEMMAKIAACEKSSTMTKRRFSNVTNTAKQHALELKKRADALKAKEKELKTRDAELKAMKADRLRLQADVDAAMEAATERGAAQAEAAMCAN
eukprot:5101328-Pleurochrysis_carterae.AAC.1